MSNKCQRCARAGRECVYTVHSKTRRRKRTDTRVKELEEKVKNLSVLLEQGKQGSGHAAGHKAKQASVDVDDDMDDESDEDSYDEDEDDQDEGLANPENDLIDETPAVGRARPPQRRQTSWKRSSPTPEPGVRESAGGGKEDKPRDVIDRGFLTMKEATELFDRYVNVLLPNYPSVVFAPGTTAAEVRQNRPILCVYSLYIDRFLLTRTQILGCHCRSCEHSRPEAQPEVKQRDSQSLCDESCSRRPEEPRSHTEHSDI